MKLINSSYSEFAQKSILLPFSNGRIRFERMWSFSFFGRRNCGSGSNTNRTGCGQLCCYLIVNGHLKHVGLIVSRLGTGRAIVIVVVRHAGHNAIIEHLDRLRRLIHHHHFQRVRVYTYGGYPGFCFFFVEVNTI